MGQHVLAQRPGVLLARRGLEVDPRVEPLLRVLTEPAARDAGVLPATALEVGARLGEVLGGFLLASKLTVRVLPLRST
jgi:hypothetical protein